MEALRERLCKESAAAEHEWAAASKALADARGKDDDLRAEVKWRVAEKQAAERAVAEAESRQAIASAGLLQAEKHSMTAAAQVAQKQALLGQLWDHEAQLLQQSKLVDEARSEAQEAMAKAKDVQQQLEAAQQELRSVRAQHEHDKYMAAALREQNRKLTEDWTALEEVRRKEELSRSQLELIKHEKDILEKDVKSHQADKEILSEKCNRMEVQLLEMKSREARMSAQVSTLQEALMTAQNDAAALRARLESRGSKQLSEAGASSPGPPTSGGFGLSQLSRGSKLVEDVPVDRRDAEDGHPKPRPFQPWESFPGAMSSPRMVQIAEAGNLTGVRPVHSRDQPAMCAPVEMPDGSDQKRPRDEEDEQGAIGQFPDTQVDEDAQAKRLRKSEHQAGRGADEGLNHSKRKFSPQGVPSSIHPSRSDPQDPPARSWPQASRGVEDPSLKQRDLMGLANTRNTSTPRKRSTGEPARAAKRSKEEVERLAHSMFSTKPEPRHLRAPPLKLYPAHIEYVLSNWDAYVARYGRGGASTQKSALKPEDLRPRQPAVGSWQAVQNFLKASGSDSPHPQRALCIVSRA